MEGLFLQVLNMSISASWFIIAVLVFRILLKKIPTEFRYILWIFVAFRLVIPFSFESELSVVPSGETFSEEFLYEEYAEIDSGFKGVDNTINSIILEQTIDKNVNKETVENQEYVDGFVENDNTNLNIEGECGTTETGLYPLQTIIHAASILWAVGIVVMLGYTLVSYIRLRRAVDVSVHLRDNLWLCDAIQSPFILGLWNPRVYIPSHIAEEQIPYIVSHEKEHLRYGDNWWKPLGYGVLVIHWFNPLVWIAYIFMCRDIELACDERVIRHMNMEEKKKYMESLLICSSPRHLVSACPVAFGEIGIKERMKCIAKYKKPAGAIFGIGAVVCVIMVISFMTNPVKEDDKQVLSDDTNQSGENVGDGSVSGIPGDDTNYETTYTPAVENKVLFETTADLDHDGIDDLVQTVLIYHPGSEAGDDVSHPANSVVVKIYRGTTDGTYEKDATVTTNIVSMTHSANGTYVLTEKDGKDYIIYSNMYQMMENAHYSYKILYLNETQLTSCAEENVYFVCDPWSSMWETGPYREDVVPAFKEGIEKWLGPNAIILVSFDVMEGAYFSEVDSLASASFYYDQVWERSEDAIVAEYNVVLGEEWQQYIYMNRYYELEDIYWIQEELASDFSEWYTDYDGSKLQRVVSSNPNQAGYGPSVNLDTIYYAADESEDVQEVLYKMFEAMLVARMEPEEGRSYTITDYVIKDAPIIQISEHMWLVKYLSGYYKYDGTDLVTYEEALPYYEEEHIIDGCIPIMMQGSDDNFWYLLMEEDDVYRLQGYHNMTPGD